MEENGILPRLLGCGVVVFRPDDCQNHAWAGFEALNWEELWDVIRWYAHNRGYDGNALWSSGSAQDSEDTKTEENANRLMATHGTGTMAETVCAFLGVDPASTAAPKLEACFKGNDAAFHRSVVHGEVVRILRAHVGVLKGCDDAFITCLCGEGKTDWQAVHCPSIRLFKDLIVTTPEARWRAWVMSPSKSFAIYRSFLQKLPRRRRNCSASSSPIIKTL